MTKKSLVTIQIVDMLSNPISDAQYQIKNQKTGQLIASGNTNKAGKIVEISRDIGTTLDVYLKSMFKDEMVKIQSFTMSKERMVVKFRSPKILLDIKTLENKGANGSYKRKTYTVKKGDTLSEIAKKNNTTVRALANLNNIKNPNAISIGQVIRLPVQIAATGNKTYQDKPKAVESKKSERSSAATKPKTSNNDNGFLEQAKKKLEKVYEDLKQKADEVVSKQQKISTTEDRSEQSTTPKTDVKNLCKNNAQCITSGKGELIREINIRLAGFGGALPSNEFTELTKKCIKQFQRDYMGVEETGKICGSLLVALDKFYYEYPVSSFMGNIACPCGKCNGYGNNRRNVKSGSNDANEYPGIHRSVIWILKALNFYLKTEFSAKKLEVAYIESGYRCINSNIIKKRTSVNHMGMALDIHFKTNGVRTAKLADMEFIRKSVMNKKMNAQEFRKNDCVYMEPTTFNDGTAGARSWVHYDITQWDKKYHADDLFKIGVENLNGKKIVDIVKEQKIEKILSCSGVLITANKLKLTERIPVKDLKFSSKGKKFLITFEDIKYSNDGKRSVYYDDGGVPGKGYCTVGYGHLVRGRVTCASIGIRADEDSISLAEAERLFDKDILEKGENNVKQSINVPLYQHEFDALVALAYNCRLLSQEAPKLCRLLNSGDYINAPKEMLDITKSNGQVMRGLVLRRQLEYKIFTENKYIDRSNNKEIV